MIRFENASKKFDHRGIAGLSNISLSINAGEIIALMGPNGSGKTTLLNVLRDPSLLDSGHVHAEGHLCSYQQRSVMETVNVQNFLISQITLDIHPDKKIQLARDLADVFEFTFQLRQNLDQLSAGQSQKILLASLLINNPTTLLLDEPFTHLDPFTRGEILESLFKYLRSREISVLWVTHDLNEALRFSDRVALMNYGKLEQVASSSELVQRPANLFVAKFLGFRNFVPVRYQGNWVTPWGNWQVENPFSKPEALMVIPEASWVVKAGGTFTCTSSVWKNLRETLEMTDGERIFWVQLSPEKNSKDYLNQVFSLEPVFQECSLIPL